MTERWTAPAELVDVVHLDHDRAKRRGYPEAIYCEHKTPDQVRLIAVKIAQAARSGDTAQTGETALSGDTALSADTAQTGDTALSGVTAQLGVTALAGDAALSGDTARTRDRVARTLFTRAHDAHARAVLDVLPDAHHDPTARLLAWPPVPPAPSGGLVVVAAAGTSDLPVAREAMLTATYLGRRAELVMDVGVAGLHRVLGRLDLLREASAVVVVAGMDGALPSVVAGLVPAPVVAVPTSVGYGAAFEGLAALLTMLNSCAPGVAVVNIDNGYGGGHLAAQIAAPR